MKRLNYILALAIVCMLSATPLLYSHLHSLQERLAILNLELDYIMNDIEKTRQAIRALDLDFAECEDLASSSLLQ